MAVLFCRNYVLGLLIIFEQPYTVHVSNGSRYFGKIYYVAVPEIEFLHKNVTCNTEAECGTVRPQNCDNGLRCGGTWWSRKYVT